MQVLGLALEVKSIEQKLSKLKTSTVNAQPPAPRPARSVKGSVQQMGEKQTNRYCGLAGKFSQFAKQIVRTVSHLNARFLQWCITNVHFLVLFPYYEKAILLESKKQ